jgi:hypothetical protein
MRWNAFIRSSAAKKRLRPPAGGLPRQPLGPNATAGLLLPGALFVAIGAELFAAFVFVNFAFAAFF